MGAIQAYMPSDRVRVTGHALTRSRTDNFSNLFLPVTLNIELT